MGPNDKCPPPSHTAEVFRKEVLHPELSYSIVGAAMKVLATLRPGLNEKAYENAMVIELAMRGHLVQQQRRFEVRYEGVVVDTLVPDLLVDGCVIVDTKVVTEFADAHISQMIGYLAITGFRLAILLNFKHTELRYQRVVR